MDVDFISKKYIKLLPKCKYDSICSLFKRQTSLEKNTDYFNVTEHEFSCILKDKPYNDKDFYQRDYL